MRVRIAVCALILFTTVIAILVSATIFDARLFPRDVAGATKAFNTHNLVRLHVVANSDSEEDQSLKLRVRDAVLAATRDLLGSVKTKEEAWRILEENVNEIRAVAADEVRKAGRSYEVQVEMGVFAFPERKYGELDLPEGHYEAVRVVLGAGKGRNWWCVLFPPLCFIRMNEDRQVEGLKSELSPGEALTRLRLDLAGPPQTQAGRTSGYPRLARVSGALVPRSLYCSIIPGNASFAGSYRVDRAGPASSSSLSLDGPAREMLPRTATRTDQATVL